ncbi:hypothetical protein HMPREF0972_00479 [Actinomyces sp. oral taxon 848 str. F0332]|nr:hypothetical protein HMPREF0972_00479 [Actinomyces sp. oral taxon 848 str. F0332]
MILVDAGTLNFDPPIASSLFMSSARLLARGEPSPRRRSHGLSSSVTRAAALRAFLMGSLTYPLLSSHHILRKTEIEDVLSTPHFVSDFSTG